MRPCAGNSQGPAAAAASSRSACASGDDAEQSEVRPVEEIPDRFGRSNVEAAPARRARGPSRVAETSSCIEDVSLECAPNGCKMRKYVPEVGNAYWHGELPKGQTSPGGRHSRRLSWGFYTQRSEAETRTLVETWLHDHAQPVV